jgi:hypothetical protein
MWHAYDRVSLPVVREAANAVAATRVRRRLLLFPACPRAIPLEGLLLIANTKGEHKKLAVLERKGKKKPWAPSNCLLERTTRPETTLHSCEME